MDRATGRGFGLSWGDSSLCLLRSTGEVDLQTVADDNLGRPDRVQLIFDRRGPPHGGISSRGWRSLDKAGLSTVNC